MNRMFRYVKTSKSSEQADHSAGGMFERRLFLATMLCQPVLPAQKRRDIIDTHVHFYDPSRPQGVPWPPKQEKLLYRTVMPSEFIKLAAPFGITGAIVVEASPWVEDNQWVLDLAAKNSFIVGIVGNLEPGKPEFAKNLERFRSNKLFLGIRFGALWGRSPAAELPRDAVLADLRRLADAGLELDVVGGPPILAQTVRLSDKLPNLRIVIDHLPFDPPAEAKSAGEYRAALRELKSRQNVFAKVSNVVRRQGDRVPDHASDYKEQLDELWDVFGRDRVIYGSNWPVSDRVAPYRSVFQVVREYFEAKGPDIADRYFRRNSEAAYRWVRR